MGSRADGVKSPFVKNSLLKKPTRNTTTCNRIRFKGKNKATAARETGMLRMHTVSYRCPHRILATEFPMENSMTETSASL